MEWCYVVCSHESLRGRRPAAGAPVPSEETIVLPLADAPTSASGKVPAPATEAA